MGRSAWRPGRGVHGVSEGVVLPVRLEINTFCAISSGAQEITERQLESLNQRMADILSTVTAGWEKAGAHPVPAPATPVVVQRPAPKTEPKPVLGAEARGGGN